MQKVKIQLFFIPIIFYNCGAGLNDSSQELSGGYVYRIDGSTSYILPDNIFNEGIYPQIKGFAYNKDFILVMQKPSKPHFKRFLSEDILTRFSALANVTDSTSMTTEEYRIMKSNFLADSSFYIMLSKKLSSNNTDEDRIKCEMIAEEIIINSPYYKNILGNKFNYWIIDHLRTKKIGPLSKEEYIKKTIELNIPKHLTQKFEKRIKNSDNYSDK